MVRWCAVVRSGLAAALVCALAGATPAFASRSGDHPKLDRELNDALKGTFPASDPVAVGEVTSTEPDRPVERKPALLDKELVHELADHLKQKSAT